MATRKPLIGRKIRRLRQQRGWTQVDLASQLEISGSYLNLIRWVSPRTVKETFVPPTEVPYPYMLPE